MVDGLELEPVLARVLVRDDAGRFVELRHIDKFETKRAYLRSAAAARWPIWIETRLEGQGSELYAQPIQPWGELNRPKIGTAGLGVLLDAVAREDLERPFFERLLELLPRLDDYGAERVVADASDLLPAATDLVVVPLVGFIPLRGDDKGLVTDTVKYSLDAVGEALERFRCVELRLSLAVVDNIVLTVQFPDRICPPSASEDGALRLKARPVVQLRARHLPKSGRDVEAIDIATGIMRYLTSTCTAVGRVIQDRLSATERGVVAEEATAAEHEFDPAEPLRQIHNLGELADYMSRACSRALRRLPEIDEPARATSASHKAFVQRTTWRMRDGLEELRHLQTEVSFARSTMFQLVSVRQLRATNAQTDNNEHFQRLVSKLGGVLLLPALIAAVWGANVWLPGKDAVPGFIGLMLVMGGGALAVYQWMESRWLHRESGSVAKSRNPPAAWTVYGVAAAVCLIGVVLFTYAAATAEEQGGGAAAASQR